MLAMEDEDRLLNYVSGCNLTDSHKSDLGMTFSDMDDGDYWRFELLGIKVMDLSNLVIFIPDCLQNLAGNNGDIRTLFDACLISYGMNSEFQVDCGAVVTDFMSILSISNRTYDFEESHKILDFIMIVGKYVNMAYNQVISGWRGAGLGLVLSEIYLTEHN